jgi:uncharacterized protein YciI
MPKWDEYKQTAKTRGSLAFELYVVESTPAIAPDKMVQKLPDHLAYQKTMEEAGKLFMAGPLSDSTGEEMMGVGMIIYRASSMEEANGLAANDPMHLSGSRTFTLRKWLVNEGSLNLSVGLSTKAVTLK